MLRVLKAVLASDPGQVAAVRVFVLHQSKKRNEERLRRAEALLSFQGSLKPLSALLDVQLSLIEKVLICWLLNDNQVQPGPAWRPQTGWSSLIQRKSNQMKSVGFTA